MESAEIIEVAFKIGSDSYELQHFMQLDKRVGIKKQIAALKRDQDWQRNHFEAVSMRIDDLIHKMEFE